MFLLYMGAAMCAVPGAVFVIAAIPTFDDKTISSVAKWQIVGGGVLLLAGVLCVIAAAALNRYDDWAESQRIPTDGVNR